MTAKGNNSVSWSFFASLVEYIRNKHFDSHTAIIISVQNSPSADMLIYTLHIKGGADRILRDLKGRCEHHVQQQRQDCSHAKECVNSIYNKKERKGMLTLSESIHTWKRRKNSGKRFTNKEECT